MNAPLIREFRLSPPGGDHGVSCDADGAFVDSVPLLKRSRAGGQEFWVPRESDELSAALGAHYGLPIDVSSKALGLNAIARSLNSGDVARAQLVTLHLAFPEFPAPTQLARSASPANELEKFVRELHWSGLLGKVWEPDDHPRWPAHTPDSQGGEFAPKEVDTDSDDLFTEGGNDTPTDDLQVAANVARKNPATIRRAWEKLNGRPWPRDPVTGRNHDVAHIRALADGGDNELTNIKPQPHDEHVAEHKANGDFSRWARLRSKIGSLGGTPRTPQSSPKTKVPGPTPEVPDEFPKDPRVLDEMIMESPFFGLEE